MGLKMSHCKPESYVVRWASLFFQIAFASFLLWTRLDNINFIEGFFWIRPYVKIALQLVFAVCVGLKIWLQRFTPRSMLVAGGFFVLAVVSGLLSQSNILLWSCILIIAGDGIRIRSIAKTALWVNALVLAIAVMGLLLGFTDSVDIGRGDGAETYRSSLGLDHPNRFGIIAVEILLSVCVLLDAKNAAGRVLAALLVSALVFLVSESRSAIAAALLALAVFWWIGNGDKGRWASSVRAMGSFVLFAMFFSIVLMLTYNEGSQIQSVLNGFLSNRPSFAHYCFETYGISALGYYVSTDWFVVDNAFCFFLLTYGWAPCLLYFFLIVKRFFASLDVNRESVVGLSGLFVCLIVGLFEKDALGVAFNYFLITLSPLIYADGSLLKINHRIPLKLEGRE